MWDIKRNKWFKNPTDFLYGSLGNVPVIYKFADCVIYRVISIFTFISFVADNNFIFGKCEDPLSKGSDGFPAQLGVNRCEL